ncbi:hypothetical protein ACP70R_040931 [Stipagrostis hirtigluma subsp. patula]
MGESPPCQGAPPYRKPHDLKKAWKVSLLSAVIEHLAPRFDQLRRLVWRSKRLQHKMSARDADTWAKVIAREEALDRQLQRSLQITPLDGDGDGQEGRKDDDDAGDDDASPRESARRGARLDKRKRVLGGEDKEASGVAGAGDLSLALADIDGVAEVDRNSIDELMKLYYQCLKGTDGEPEVADDAVACDEGQSDAAAAAVAEATHDAPAHDDTLDGLLSVAGVVDMSDFRDSPIWQWGVYD